MARVPILLTLLAMTYEETQTFPQRRVEIYEEALDALLKKWDARRQIKRDESYKALSLRRKRQMFTQIAAETFEENNLLQSKKVLCKRLEAYMSKVHEGTDDIDGESALESIAAQHGIFVEQARNIYSFAHLSFQEYYAAKYIVDNALDGAVKGLFEHISEDRWREVFLLTANLLDEDMSNSFFELFIKHTNKIVDGQLELQDVLMWAHQKTMIASSRIISKPYALRAFFAFDRAKTVALHISIEKAGGLDNIDSDNIDHDLVQSIAHITNLDLTFEHTLKLDKFLDRIISIADRRVFAIMHYRDYSEHTRYDIDRVNELIRYDIDRVKWYSIKLGLKVVEQELSGLVVPGKEASGQEWRAFRNAVSIIRKKLRESLGLSLLVLNNQYKKPNISEKAIYIFGAYSRANQLLIDCLNLAIVKDRDAILDQLFLPASES